MTHDLKIWPRYYAAVSTGEKTFEVRNNDRGFQKGDEVVLRYFDADFLAKHPDLNAEDTRKEWDRLNKPLHFTVGFVFHLDAQRVVFSLLDLQ